MRASFPSRERPFAPSALTWENRKSEPEPHTNGMRSDTPPAAGQPRVSADSAAFHLIWHLAPYASARTAAPSKFVLDGNGVAAYAAHMPSHSDRLYEIVVRAVAELTGAGADLDPQLPLLQLGITSMRLIALLSVLEERLRMHFSDADLVPENFYSIDAVVRLLASYELALEHERERVQNQPV